MKQGDKSATGRLGWIDAAKGIGIALVVFGHAVDGLRSAGLMAIDGPLADAFYAIYTFHMPLFFFLSGVLVMRRVERDRAGFVRKLVPSIAWPYLLWSTVQLTLIHLASSYVNSPIDVVSLRTYLAIIWAPPSQFWFLYVLFLYHLASALMAGRLSPLYMVLLGALLYQIPDLTGDHGKMTELICHFFFFYALGVYCGPSLARLSEDLGRRAGLNAAVAAAILAVAVALGLSQGLGYWSAAALPAALAGTALVLILSIRARGIVAASLEYLGQCAMAIYVLHVMFVAGARIVVTHLTGVADAAILVPALTLIGIAGPLIALELLGRAGWSARLGLGARVAPRKLAYG